MWVGRGEEEQASKVIWQVRAFSFLSMATPRMGSAFLQPSPVHVLLILILPRALCPYLFKPLVLQLPFWHLSEWNRTCGLAWLVTLVYPGGQQKPCTGSLASKKWPVEPESLPSPWLEPVAYLHQTLHWLAAATLAVRTKIIVPEAATGVEPVSKEAPLVAEKVMQENGKALDEEVGGVERVEAKTKAKVPSCLAFGS